MSKNKKKYTPGENNLTNNFAANIWILAASLTVLFLLSLFGVMERWGLKLIDHSAGGRGYLNYLLVYVGAWVLTSYWFSPDLDIHGNRPGKYSFPFSPIIKLIIKIKKEIPWLRGILFIPEMILQGIHYPFNFFWRWVWEPFGHAFTHRGIIHVPVVGTLLKLVYATSIYWIIARLLLITDIYSLPLSRLGWFDALFSQKGLYGIILTNNLALTAFFAAVLSDICHIGIDYYDTIRNGSKNFIPPAHIAPRGYIYKFFQFLKKALFGK